MYHSCLAFGNTYLIFLETPNIGVPREPGLGLNQDFNSITCLFLFTGYQKIAKPPYFSSSEKKIYLKPLVNPLVQTGFSSKK